MHEKSCASLKRGATARMCLLQGDNAGSQGHCDEGRALKHPELESCCRPKEGSQLKNKQHRKKVRAGTGEGMRRSGCRSARGLLEQAWGEGARIWRQPWGRPGYQRWSEAAPCQGAGSRRWHSSWLEAELPEAGAAFLCRQGQKGHLARPLLAETHPVAPSELLPPCPT